MRLSVEPSVAWANRRRSTSLLTHIAGRSQRAASAATQDPPRPHAAKLKPSRTHCDNAHDPIPQQGQWLRQVVRGYFAYHAVPTNIRRLGAFRHHVGRLWLQTLRRRSQKDRFSWDRLTRLAEEWLPTPRLLHPWPDARFAVTHPR
jgi:hypothetical protein